MIYNLKRELQSLINLYHLLRAFLANIWYGMPSHRLKVIGVTGTDGKTTTTHLIYHILKSSGKKVSMISTIFAKIGDKEYDTGFHVTTPDAMLVPRYLKMALSQGQEYFVLETTSHRLDQNQLFGTKYQIGVVTNITHEHLDYHKTYGEYVKAKYKLLLNSRIGIINRDDESYDQILNLGHGGHTLKTFGLKNKADYTYKFDNEIAEFNRYNYLAAYAVCRELGISEKEILKAVETFELPKGRFEVVYDKKFTVIIDFAHTPNAFMNLLPAIREQYLKKGRLVHVFGAAGLRDSTKRPMMGEASGSYSNLVILTEEDYRTEDASAICSQIAVGLEKKGFKKTSFDYLTTVKDKYYSVILNREKAIKMAISSARPGDVVVITGKSHEKSLCRGKVEYPYSEHEAVKKSLPE